ncbi:MAG: hypothetical protein N2606_05275 [Candidatus Omnitrophica bacterium]|nr:hypothetical protein [Candidatus Omnitrophota bacterium]
MEVKRFKILSLVFIILSFFMSSSEADNWISYLPRQQDMDTRFKSYTNLVLEEVGANATNPEGVCKAKEFRQAADCYKCILEWLPNCHRCCIETINNKKQIKCQNTCESLFNTDCSCETLVSLPPDNCSQKDGIWYCKSDKEIPQDVCLNTLIETKKSSLGCNLDSRFVFEKPVLIQDVNECPVTVGVPCYKYLPTFNYQKCQANCRSAENEMKNCQNNLQQCKNKACSASDCMSGKKLCGQNLYNQICNSKSCQEIVASSFCNWDIDHQKCVDLTNSLVDCLATTQTNSECARCFKEIDSSFYYEFIAKSRQSVTLLWEISSTPYWVRTGFTKQIEGELAPAYFLYTRLKVFDVEDPNTPIYMSPVHQKYLGAAFSIFSAAHLEVGKLKAGHKYRVGVYYFLANTPDYDLKIKINSLRITAIRIRE